MALDRATKEKLLDDYHRGFAKSPKPFVVGYRGMSVPQVDELRAKVRASGGRYQVVKNTLLHLAAKDTPQACLDPFLAGPTALAIAAGDPVAPAKVLSDFAKANAKFELKGGALEGRVLSVAEIVALADLPSREVLLAKMLGSMSAPATNFVGVLAAVPRSLVQVLAAIQDQKAA